MAQKFFRVSDVASTKKKRGRYPFSPATAWRLVAQGKFPAPIKLADNITAWEEKKLDEWDAQKVAEGQRA